MKKWFVFLTVLVLLFCAACGANTDSPVDNTEDVKSGITYVEATEAKIPETEPVVDETEAPATEAVEVPVETQPAAEDDADKVVFEFPTDELVTDTGRWIADMGGGSYDSADLAGARIEPAGEVFEGNVIAMETKSGVDYNLMYWMGDDGRSQDTGLTVENGKLSLWVYVSDIDVIYESSWTEIDVGCAEWIGTDWAYWNLQQVFWQEGWNYVELDFSTAIIEGNFDMSALRWIRFCVVGCPDGEEFRLGQVRFIEK